MHLVKFIAIFLSIQIALSTSALKQSSKIENPKEIGEQSQKDGELDKVDQAGDSQTEKATKPEEKEKSSGKSTVESIDAATLKLLEKANKNPKGSTMSQVGIPVSNEQLSTYTYKYGNGDKCMKQLRSVSKLISYNDLKTQMSSLIEPGRNTEWYIGNNKQSVVFGCSPAKFIKLSTEIYNGSNPDFKCASVREYEILKNLNKDNLVIDRETLEESSTIGLRNLCAYLSSKVGFKNAASMALSTANLLKHPHAIGIRMSNKSSANKSDKIKEKSTSKSIKSYAKDSKKSKSLNTNQKNKLDSIKAVVVESELSS